MSYEQSAKNRQAILDDLHANPSRDPSDLPEVLGISRNGVKAALKFMREKGEVSKVGSYQHSGYRALVTTTISAKQVIAEMRERKASGVKTTTMPSGKQRSQGYYCQLGGTWKATASQGGQGAVRERTGVSCSMDLF